MPRVQVLLPLPFGPVVQLVRTLACHARGRRFEPDPGRQFAGIAQAAERILGKDEVGSSSLPISSIKNRLIKPFFGSGLDFFMSENVSLVFIWSLFSHFGNHLCLNRCLSGVRNLGNSSALPWGDSNKKAAAIATA